jgi:hypothetical protein
MAVVAGAAALSMGLAQAAYIVDTGPAPAGGTALALESLGVSYQNLGATFNVAQHSSITSVEGWIGGTGSLLFELHQGATPNGALLYSSLVSFNNGADAWKGALGLAWDVLAGDYTLAVIAQPGFNGQMLVSPPNPLATNWFANPLNPNWGTTTFTMGWRVGADPAAAVPEPGSLALAAFGLAALVAGARRRRPA